MAAVPSDRDAVEEVVVAQVSALSGVDRARSLMEQNRLDDARAELLEVLRQDRDDTEALALYDAVALRMGVMVRIEPPLRQAELEEAEVLYTQSIRTELEKLLRRAEQALENAEPDDAERMLQRFDATRKWNPEVDAGDLSDRIRAVRDDLEIRQMICRPVNRLCFAFVAPSVHASAGRPPGDDPTTGGCSPPPRRIQTIYDYQSPFRDFDGQPVSGAEAHALSSSSCGEAIGTR